MRRTQRAGGKLATMLLTLLALSGGIVGAQTEAEPDADTVTISTDAVPVTLEFSIGEISAPERFWLDGAGLHIRDLTGIDTVNGDINGTATTRTHIGWTAPCHTDTLICRGAQVSFQELEITDEHGAWDGALQLVIDPAQGADSVSAILVGRGGNAGQVLYLDEVTGRTDASVSVAGYQIANVRPVGGVNLTTDVCLQDDTTATGGFLGSYSVADSGALEMTLSRGIDAALGMAVAARFDGAHGTLQGAAIERETTAGGSAGRFVLLGGDGAYDGYLGFGRTGSQLIESANCAGGYALHSFWIGEVVSEQRESVGDAPTKRIESDVYDDHATQANRHHPPDGAAPAQSEWWHRRLPGLRRKGPPPAWRRTRPRITTPPARQQAMSS